MDPVEKYFIHEKGEVKGPFSLVRLINLVKDGKLPPDINFAEEGEESTWVSLAAHAPKEVAEAIRYGIMRKTLALLGVIIVVFFAAAFAIMQFLLLPSRNAARADLEALENENAKIRQALDGAEVERRKMEAAIDQSQKLAQEAKSAAELAEGHLTDALKDAETIRSRVQKVESAAVGYANKLAAQTLVLQQSADIPEKVRVSVVCNNGILKIDKDAIDAVITNALTNAGFGVTTDPEDGVAEAILVFASIDQLRISEENMAAYTVSLKCYTRCVRGDYIRPYTLFDDGSIGYAGAKSGYSQTIREFFANNIEKCIVKLNQLREEAADQKPISELFSDLQNLGISPHEKAMPSGMLPDASGSGVIIASRPLILTNHHVIAKARRVLVHSSFIQQKEAIVLYEDARSDLAILTLKEKTEDFSNDTFAVFAGDQDLQIGSELYSLGYPMSALLGSELKFSSGAISSVKGLKDDPESFQLSAPIQPGSSGGPVFLRSGKLAGIVVSTLNSLEFAKATSTLPQNVNYALRSDTILRFLRENGLLVEVQSEKREELTIDKAKRHIVRIEVFGE
jgi:S1-C subfamily serine protease